MTVRIPAPRISRRLLIGFVLGALVATPMAVYATHNFDDVPDDAFYHDDVEAILDAGVTAGCSIDTPLYCPNNAVTRGEMAVFLNKLGALDGTNPPSVNAADSELLDGLDSSDLLNDEVTVVTLTGGPVDTTGPLEQVTIPLNGESSFTFTQRAGEAVHLIATVDADPGDSTFCGVNTMVYGDGSPLAARVDLFTDRGEVGDGSGIGGLAAPVSDTTVTLKAFTRELEDCDQDPIEEGDGPDTWSVSITVTVVILRN